jgi:ABC-type glycerol-3-phosphate transport system substrate-binding protein
MKKRMIALVMVLAMALAVVGCSSNTQTTDTAAGTESEQTAEATSAPADTESEDITLTFYWTSLESDTQDVFREYYIAPFEESHPGVHIDFVCSSDMEANVRVQLAAGAGPDMFRCDCYMIPDYAKSGYIMDLEECAEANWEGLVYDWALDACRADGDVYALPHAVEVTGLYYNADLLSQLGLEVPSTLEEFENCCQTAIDNGYVAVAYSCGNKANNNQWLIGNYLNTYCGTDAVADLFTGETTFADPQISGAFAKLKEHWDADFYSDGMSEAINGSEGRSQFLNGEALFDPEGTWLSISTVTPGTWGFNWGFTTWPSMRDGVASVGGMAVGQAICVNAATAHADLVQEFLTSIYSASDEWVAEGISTVSTCSAARSTRMRGPRT